VTRSSATLLKHPHILIIDDDDSSILLLGNMLADFGKISFCTSSAEALSLIQERKPDLVLLDIHMPDMDGFELCSAIKRDRNNQDLPVIFITADVDADCEVCALECRAVDFIAKPFNAPVVRAKIRTHWALKQRTDELVSSLREREHIQARLQKYHDMLASLVAQVPGVLYQYRRHADGRSDCPFISPSVRDIYGIDPESLRQDASPLIDLIHPEDRDAIMQSVLESGATLQKWKQEYRVVVPHAEVRWVLSESMPEKLDDGSVVWHGYIRDITEHRQMQAAIAEKEHFLQLFIENAPISIVMFDKEMRYLSVSKHFLEDFDLTEEDLIGRSHYEVFPDLPNSWHEFHNRSLAGETIRREEDLFIRANGKTDWVRWEIRPWFREGEVGGIILFREYITERKKAQERERRLMNIYHALSAANDAIIHVDSESALFPLVCRIAVEFGGMMTAMVAIPNEENQFVFVASHGKTDFVEEVVAYATPTTNEGRGTAGTAFRDMRAVMSADFSNEGMMAPWQDIAKKQGIRSVASFPIIRSGQPYGVFVVYNSEADGFDEEIGKLLNELAGNIGFALDNYDRNAGLAMLSAQLIETQEQERKKLAMELHDELGQRLTVLNLNLHQMRHSLVGSRAETAWHRSLEEVDFLMEKIHTMSGSLRPPTLDRLGLESAIKHLLRQHFANTGIDYIFEYAGLPKKMPGSVEITLYRAVQEAITNVVRHAAATQVVVEINGDEHGNEIELIVRDNGVGFDRSAADKRRTRFGLIGLQERVGLLGGTLQVKSEKGRGTRIKIMLPLADGKRGSGNKGSVR